MVVAIVKEGEVGRKMVDVVSAYGISEQTDYRWKAPAPRNETATDIEVSPPDRPSCETRPRWPATPA